MYHDIVGDASLVYNPGYCKRGVWRTSDSAKWISMNSFGRHTHSNSKPDPANLNCRDDTRPIAEVISCSNTYVFRLKGVNLGELKDAKKLEIGFSGAVDNYVRVKINGHEMKVLGNENGARPEGTQYSGWGFPGYVVNSRFTAETQPGTVLVRE